MTVQSPTPASPGAAGELPKQYRPIDHESRIWSRWESSDAFHADPTKVRPDRSNAYCILIPPPNVTARLHLGHALTYTLQDVLTRLHRMMGYETLWMPGTDHAAIATQAVVEKRIQKEEGKRRTDFTREQFVAKVQAFKDEYEAAIIGQLKRMGSSCDWARLRYTMDEVCNKAVYEAFFRLFKDGLIYRGKRLVNWDPVLQTAVAEDECYDEEIDGQFYYLRYPLVHLHGASTQRERESGALPPGDAVPVSWSELESRGYPGAEDHPDEEQAYLTVATTRPETYLGDTAVAVNPHDPRAKSLRGLCVELPLVGRVIPIIEDGYVVLPSKESPWAKGLGLPAPEEGASEDPKAAFATGFLKVTPAHDTNDYELYQRHKEVMDRFQGGTALQSGGSALINIFAPDARVSDKHGWTDVKGAHIFVGKKREEARKLAVSEFKARTVAGGSTPLLAETKPYRHSVKHSDRSKAIVEPYLSDQWYVKVTDPRLAGAANRALASDQRPHGGTMRPSVSGDAALRFYPARYAKTYEQWHDNIRDWCISRQLWWGQRIPVWYKAAFQQLSTEAEKALRVLQMEGRIFIQEVQPDYPASPIAARQWETERKSLPQRASTDEDANALRRHSSIFVCVRDSEDAETTSLLEGLRFTQDPDVLDTWFSSGMWPMSTMGWPDPKAAGPEFPGLLEAFNPSSVLCTAREIITLWVSRMVMFNRYFMPEGWGEQARSTTALESGATKSATLNQMGRGKGPVPYKDVFIHAVIQDGEGRKMSKTLGNGVDPVDIIESHGADALRFTLCHMTTQTQDVRMPVVKDSTTGKNTSPKFDIGRNFANKLWNAARFAVGIVEGAGSTASGEPRTANRGELSLVDRWMLSRLRSGVESCTAALKAYEFSEYAQTLYRLVWDDFCDWYLEAIKPTVGADPLQRAVLRNALDALLRLAHPAMPFITEAIYERVGGLKAGDAPFLTLARPRKAGLLATAGWPEVSDQARDEKAEAHFARLQALVTAIREVKAQHQVNPKRRITLHAQRDILDAIEPVSAAVHTVAGLERATADAPDGASVAFRFESMELRLSNLADAVDAGAEKSRLEKQISELEKSIKTLSGRLANPGYAERAPAAMVQQSRDQLSKAESDLVAARTALAGLGG